MSLLSDFNDVVSILIREWIDKIDGIANFFDPAKCPAAYLPHLSKLLGFPVSSDYDSTDEIQVSQLRSSVVQTIDWYKAKGTYRSLQIIGLMLNLNITFYDMYTNDYIAFINVPWFSGKSRGDNPLGLDSSYYKSPHFGAWINLNHVYEATATIAYRHLWNASYANNLRLYVEKTRPVHTVPHYILFINPWCDIPANVYQVEGEINTKFVGTFPEGTLHLDGEAEGSGLNWYFDEGKYFDTSISGYIEGITKWVLGDGNTTHILPGGSGFTDIINPILTGSIDPSKITDEGEYYQFEFTIPKALAGLGLNELGLYTPGTPDVLEILSEFPSIDLDSSTEMVVKVRLYKKSLV
jgi:hypothetical protein